MICVVMHVLRYSMFSRDVAMAETPEPGKLTLEVDANMYTIFGLPAFSHSSSIFKISS